MLWIALYVAFVAYAAGLFIWTVVNNRQWAAVGILLSVSGFQLAALDTLSDTAGIAIALTGLACVGRDIVGVLLPKVEMALVRGQREVEQS
jgi:hypothetical protein